MNKNIAALIGAVFLSASTLAAAQTMSPSGKPLYLPLSTVPDNEPDDDIAPAPKAAAASVPALATSVAPWAGVAAHQTDLVNQGGITGAGVKVCVIADGVDQLSSYQTSGDLPAVTIPTGYTGSGGTGTAMLMAIHHEAPDAQLAFASYQVGSLTGAINALKPLGCHIMVDAALFEAGNAFQLPLASTSAIDSVVSQGTTYITAAGDGGNVQNGTSGTYEGDFTPWTGTPPTGFPNGTLFHSFNGNPYLTLDTATSSVTLEWDDPDGAASMADYDLYVTDPTGATITAYSNNLQATTHHPLETAVCGAICHFQEGSRVYVVKYAGDARALRIRTDSNRGTVTPSTIRAIQGHHAWPNAITVGAVPPPTSCASYACQQPGLFQNSVSSDGYRQVFFSPSGQPFTPGNYLINTNGGIGYIKPDIAAVSTGAFASYAPFFFNGSTAGAAASAAGIAALLKQARPDAQNNLMWWWLTNHAYGFGFAVPNAGMGYGVPTAPTALMNALQALAATKSYAPSFLAAGNPSQYTASITNYNNVALTNVGWNDNLAAPIAATPGLTVQGVGCSGSVSATPGSTSFSLSSVTVPPHTTCTWRLYVVPASAGMDVTTPAATVTTPFGMLVGSNTARLQTAAAGIIDVAAAANGATVTTSTTYDSQHPASSIIDGVRMATSWGSGGGWADGTPASFPDTITIDFGTTRTIDRIVLYTLEDDYAHATEPTDTETFTSYGVTDFDVQVWDGAHWITVNKVRGNNLVRRVVTFPPATTSQIRVSILGAAGGTSTVTEIEAWSTTATSVNVAHFLMGTTVTASSTLGRDYPAYSINDGQLSGNWSHGGGWADATTNVFPDWVVLDFGLPRTIDHVTLYTLGDDWNAQNPAVPTTATTFNFFGVTDYTVEGWDGASWVQLGTVSGNNHVISTVNFQPFLTQKIRVTVTNALYYVSRITEIQAWSTSAAPVRRLYDVALASTGAVAVASSSAGPGFAPSGAIDGDPSGTNWTNGGGWADGTIDTYPDVLEVDLNGSFDIDNVTVYSVQDDWQHPVLQPSDTMTFTQYGLLDFHVDAWDGAQWVTLGSVTGNNLVKRTVSFSTFTTTKVRVVVTNALAALSRIPEFVVMGSRSAAPMSANVAAASAGATASASSQLSTDFPASATIDGDRAGHNWSAGGGWADGTIDSYPDWLQVSFAGLKTIDHVVVYTLQDNWQNPSDPTDAMTFTQYGVTDFTVQGWDGTKWVTLGTVTGNNLVKRTVSFGPFTTNAIRINVTNALSSLSRITEVEAWGVAAQPAGTNLALSSSAGGRGIAIASSVYQDPNLTFNPSGVNDGDRTGAGKFGKNGVWIDGTPNQYPDSMMLYLPFATYNSVVIYGMQDQYLAPAEPSDDMVCTQYCLQDFEVQLFDFTLQQWFTVAHITDNHFVKRTVAFNPYMTNQIRVNVTRGMGGYSRMVEFEAYGN